jgi:hypothetical protein
MPIVRLEGVGQLKNAMASWEIEPVTFWFVALSLNKQLYRVPPPPPILTLN